MQLLDYHIVFGVKFENPKKAGPKRMSWRTFFLVEVDYSDFGVQWGIWSYTMSQNLNQIQ